MQKLFVIFLVFFVCKSTYTQDFWMELDTPDSVTIYQTEIATDGNILLGTNKGIYFSQNEGLTWEMGGDNEIH